MKRPTALAGVLALVIAAAGVGWVGGSRIKSPAQVAAETAPPEPSPITVPVERITLSADVIVRGTIAYESLQSFSLDTPPATEGGISIVTGAPPSPGDVLVEGMVVLEVSDRPVFVFVGELPAFRTIRPGVEGDDVRQLEEALGRLGLDPGPIDGVYDEATEGAVTQLYQNAGYTPNGSSPEEQQALGNAKDAVDSARSALTAAQAALTEARRGPSESAVIRAEAELEAARRALDAAIDNATVDDADAADAAISAQADLDATTAARNLAADRLAQAQGGTHPDTGVAPTSQELQILEDDLTDAEAGLALTQAALDDALRDQTLIERTGVEGVASAQANIAVAQASLNEMNAAPDTTFQSQTVSDAETGLTDVQADLAALETQVGVVFAKSELVFMRTLPLDIEEVLFARGDFVSGNLYQLTGSDIKITSSIPLADLEFIQEGAEVLLEDDVFNLAIRARITEIADRPATNGVADQRVYVELAALEDIPIELIGASVKVTIPIRSTAGEVLAVPVAALSATASDDVRVEVLLEDGSTTFVEVRRGLSTGGMVEVEAIDGSLAAGDLVVIGMER